MIREDRLAVVEQPRARSASGWVLAAIVCGGVLLRACGLGDHTLDFDETFTGAVARRSPGEILEFLRAHDQHPPLDYLLRIPFAAAGSDALLRLPSVVMSSVALALFAVWMRARGRIAIIATLLIAVSGFEIFYARQARMYALVLLVGVVCAASADRWLRRPRDRDLVTVGGALLVGLFTSVSALLLAGGLLWLPGLRNDRSAWRWRVAVALPTVIWAVAWLPTVFEQLSHDPASWIPFTSPTSIAKAVAHPVTLAPGLIGIAAALVALGGVIMARSDQGLARVALCCFGLPLIAAAALGVTTHFFVPRTLVFGSWVPLCAIACLIDWALTRRVLIGVAVATLVATIMVPSTWRSLDQPLMDGDDRMVAALKARVERGDVVAIRPDWARSRIEWVLGVQRPGAEQEVTVPVRNSYALAIDAATPRSGRVWLLEDAASELRLDAPRCASTWRYDGRVIRCLELGPES